MGGPSGDLPPLCFSTPINMFVFVVVWTWREVLDKFYPVTGDGSVGSNWVSVLNVCELLSEGGFVDRCRGGIYWEF